MIYLMIQIGFLLVLAAAFGVAVGWWVRGKTPDRERSPFNELPDNPFDARFRLEQCHRDNATLRRELKDMEERAEKLQSRYDSTDHIDDGILERLETAEIRAQALLEDLQVRDDTIQVLERELESLRAKS